MSVFLTNLLPTRAIKHEIENSDMELRNTLKKYYDVPTCPEGYFVTAVTGSHRFAFMRLLLALDVPRNNVYIYLKGAFYFRAGLLFAEEIRPKVKDLSFFQKRLLQNLLSFEAYDSLGLEIEINPPR
jgi:hypothetical protein